MLIGDQHECDVHDEELTATAANTLHFVSPLLGANCDAS